MLVVRVPFQTHRVCNKATWGKRVIIVSRYQYTVNLAFAHLRPLTIAIQIKAYRDNYVGAGGGAGGGEGVKGC